MTVPPSRRHRRIAALAMVSIVILTVGWAIRPRNAANPPTAPPSELDLPRLSQAAERRSVESTTAYFAGLASRFSAVLVRARGPRSAGIVWKPNLIVTPRADAWSVQSAAPALEAGEEYGAATIAGPQLPLIGVQVPAATTTGVARGTKPKRPGDAVLAVWLTDTDQAFAPGVYYQQTSSRCWDAAVDEVVTSVAVSDVMVGGAVFDTEGYLLAMVLRCGERSMAVAASSVDDLLDSAATPEGRLVARHGLVVGRLTEAEAAFFRSSTGAIVREIWAGYPAARAGIIPGDIIQAINGTAVNEPSDVASLAVTPDDGVAELSVRRGAKLLTLGLTSPAQQDVPVPPRATPLGLIWEAGFRIDGVLRESPAASAGARPGDRLVRLNQELVGTSHVRTLLSGKLESAVFVEFARRDRHWGALVR